MLSKVEALETRQLLATAPPLIVPPPVVPPPVVVSAAPKVAFVQLEPLTGRVLVAFTGDPSGYNNATLTNPANYSFTPIKVLSKFPSENPSRPSAGVVLAPSIQVTGVTIATPVAAGQPQSLIVSINNNQPLREGSYLFQIRSAGISDLAGRTLDGHYSGVFPSGEGQPGSDFVAVLTSVHNTVLPAEPVGPTTPASPGEVKPSYVFYPSTSQVIIRYAAAKPGKFMLSGGNNITLIPLRGRFYPGTFRPRDPKHPLAKS